MSRRFRTPWPKSQSLIIASSYGRIKRRTQRPRINHPRSPFFCSSPCCTHVYMHAIAGVEWDGRSVVLTILISHTEHHPSPVMYAPVTWVRGGADPGQRAMNIYIDTHPQYAYIWILIYTCIFIKHTGMENVNVQYLYWDKKQRFFMHGECKKWLECVAPDWDDMYSLTFCLSKDGTHISDLRFRK